MPQKARIADQLEDAIFAPKGARFPHPDVFLLQRSSTSSPALSSRSQNYGDEELLLYVYGTPPETEKPEILDSVV